MKARSKKKIANTVMVLIILAVIAAGLIFAARIRGIL